KRVHYSCGPAGWPAPEGATNVQPARTAGCRIRPCGKRSAFELAVTMLVLLARTTPARLGAADLAAIPNERLRRVATRFRAALFTRHATGPHFRCLCTHLLGHTAGFLGTLLLQTFHRIVAPQFQRAED